MVFHFLFPSAYNTHNATQPPFRCVMLVAVSVALGTDEERLQRSGKLTSFLMVVKTRIYLFAFCCCCFVFVSFFFLFKL